MRKKSLEAGLAQRFFGVLTLRYAWALAFPGNLIFSNKGMELDFGLMRRSWRWDEVSHVSIDSMPTFVCSIILMNGKSIRLFGWDRSGMEVSLIVEQYLESPQ
jgi:hypothetical protein